jgi:hypothetical protein
LYQILRHILIFDYPGGKKAQWTMPGIKKLLESFFFPLLQTPYEIFLIDHCPYSYFVRIKVNKNK